MAVLDAELRAAGRSFADLLGVTRDAHPERRQRRHPRHDRRAARRGGRLRRRRLRPHQAEDRAGLGPRAGRRGAPADRAGRPAAGRRQHRLHARRRRPPLPASTSSTCCSSSSRCPRTTSSATPDSPRRSPRRSASTSRSRRRPSPPTPSSSGPCEIVNIKPGRVGGYLDGPAHPRPVPRARRAGVVRRDAGDGHRPGRQRRARRARRVHAARRHLGVAAVLGARHRHRADRRRRRPRRRARRARASASSSTGSSSTRSRRRARRRLRRDRPTTLPVHATPVPVRRVDGRGQGHPRALRRPDRQGHHSR